MDRDSAESMDNRTLLVTIAVEVGILNERTEGLPELRQRVTKIESDMAWVKRFFWGWAVPGTLALVGVLVKLVR